MAIQVATDLVLDVARAVAPDDLRAATRRLATLGPADGLAFADTVTAAGLGTPGSLAAADPLDDALPADALDALHVLKSDTARATGETRGGLSPVQKFEAFLLRTMVEQMVGTGSETAFGDRTAGPIWRSLFAEKVGDAMAERGGVGIARLIEEKGIG